MAYTKQEFVHGQTLTANHLNHIEDGIAQLDTTVSNVEKRVTTVEGNIETITASVTESETNNNNAFSNAMKGVTSGSTVSLTDASPLDHHVGVTVHGKNLWNNLSLQRTYTDGATIYISDVSPNSITVTNTDSYNGNGYTQSWIKLREICPHLRAGMTCTLSAQSIAWIKGIYLKESDCIWYFNSTMVVTEKMLNSEVGFYGTHIVNGQAPGDLVISNVQLEEGRSATNYIPYAVPDGCVVTVNDSVELTADDAGNTEGLDSVPYYMTFKSNIADAIITVEYNRDATAVINDLLTRIHALENQI